jgi:hypothetical protein
MLANGGMGMAVTYVADCMEGPLGRCNFTSISVTFPIIDITIDITDRNSLREGRFILAHGFSP